MTVNMAFGQTGALHSIPGALPQATMTDGLRPKEPNSKSSLGGYLQPVKSTAVTNAGAETAVGGTSHRGFASPRICWDENHEWQD